MTVGRFVLAVSLVLVALTFSAEADTGDATGGDAPCSHTLIPNMLMDEIAPPVAVFHDYGSMSLVCVREELPKEVAGHSHLLPETSFVRFRGWSGAVLMSPDLSQVEEGVFVLNLIGPLDRLWSARLESAGLEILAWAHPHALVVRADASSLGRAARIKTSEGYPIIRGFEPLPDEARVHRSLVGSLRDGGPADALDLRVSGYGGPLPENKKRDVLDRATVSIDPGELPRLLREHPEIGYVEPVFSIVEHNNLAARSGLVAAEPLWDFGYNGAGVIVSHNDSGVDLSHPDLADSVVATNGRMAYADTAHGTHTAGSIVGRGSPPSPANDAGCGDLTEALPMVRGMAWGAELVTNNIFEEGYGQVVDMMAWGVRNGAQLSSNSWGLVGLGDPAVGYTAAAVAADAAVRDADPEQDGTQPLTIFFSAGNVGPDPGSVTSPATAKNVITIGAVQNDRCGAWVPDHQPGPDPEMVLTTSGRGPSQGRVKPDLVAPGSDVLSTESSDDYAVQFWDQSWTGSIYALNSGTSQACAIASGAGAVLHEYLWRVRGRRPSPALLKAALVVTANAGSDGVDHDRGWGRLDLGPIVGDPDYGSLTLMDQDETGELITGGGWAKSIAVRSSAAPLKLALVWTDPPGEADSDHPLVNDLDLVLTSPSGGIYRGNVFAGGNSLPNPGSERDLDNNVEVIRVDVPEVGTWIARIVGVSVSEVPEGLAGQDFALAITGDAGPCAEPPPAPLEVRAQQLGDNRIRVDWSVVSGATRYEISRSEHPGGQPYLPIATIAAGVDRFFDTDVSGGSEYFYVVQAYRGCWSVYSAEASATATGQCRLPPVFAGIESVDSPSTAGCSLELGWERVESLCSGVTAYTIYRGDEPDFEPGPDNVLVENAVSSRWLDQRLEWGRDYYYIVRASHYAQDFDDGNTVVLGGRPVGPLDVYLDEDVEGSVDGWAREQGSAADTGTEPWGVTEDDAWAGDRAWFVAEEDRVKDQVLRTLEPMTLPAGTEAVLEFDHRYRLDSRRDGGRLEYSTNGGRDWFDILAGDGQTVPDDPQRWLSAGYTDTIGAPSNPLFRTEGWTGDSRGWVHSRLDLADFSGSRLLLRWRMGCDDSTGTGWGWWLDEIRVVEEHECGSCVVFEPLWNLTAEATGDGVLLEWVSSGPYDRIRISRGNGPEGPFEVLAVVDAPASSYHDTSASGGTSYTYVHAEAYDGCWSDNSTGVTVTAGGPCKKPPLFWGLDEVNDPRDTTCAMDLQWREATPGCEGSVPRYRVYRSESPGFEPGPESLVADGVAGPRFRDLTVSDGVLNYYRVRAVDGVSGAEDANPVVHSGWTTGPDVVHFSDSVEGEPNSWLTGVGSSQDSGTEPWQITDDVAHTGSRSWFCRNESRIKDQVVGLTDSFEIVDDSTVISFFHYYDVEPFWDGGRFEYSTDDGTSWHDILDGDGATVGENPDRFINGTYSGFVSVGTGHPFGGERAWTGFDTGWTETVVDLADFVGLSLRFRWRLGCDRADARLGWWLDDIEVRTTSRCERVELPPPRPAGDRRP